jgi:hypothetical protein
MYSTIFKNFRRITAMTHYLSTRNVNTVLAVSADMHVPVMVLYRDGLTLSYPYQEKQSFDKTQAQDGTATRSFAISNDWNAVYIQENYVLPRISILFERIDKCNILDEANNL